MRRSRMALYALCLSTLLVVLDSTIANVALPTLKLALDLSGTSLAWVVNAYTLTFGGSLLLWGRLGDLYGRRRLFFAGIWLFAIASLFCGLATSSAELIAARAVQGFGAALISALSLSLITDLYKEKKARSRALGVYSFVSAGGAAVGVLLGGLLVGIDWHWIFFINVPICLLVGLLTWRSVPRDVVRRQPVKFDVLGAFLIIAAPLLTVYTIVTGSQVGWANPLVVISGLAAIVSLVGFICVEEKVKQPLVPIVLFKNRAVAFSNGITFVWSGAMLAWFFLTALYLQAVLAYSPLQVGLAFMAQSVTMAVISLRFSAKLGQAIGLKWSVVLGSSLVAIALLLFARAPVAGTYITDVLPGMILVGLGAGIAMNPLMFVAMKHVPRAASGLASGLVNTSLMLGGAIGLAILSAVAAVRTASITHMDAIAALNAGYQTAFLVGAVFAGAAAVTALITLKNE